MLHGVCCIAPLWPHTSRSTTQPKIISPKPTVPNTSMGQGASRLQRVCLHHQWVNQWLFRGYRPG